jgi:hypothetical protein
VPQVATGAGTAGPRRRRTLVLVAAAVAAALLAGGLTALALSRRTETPVVTAEITPAPPGGTRTTVQQQVRRVPDTSGIPGVLAWDTGEGPGTLEHQHVTGPVTYSTTPPVGGPHAPVWMNAGVYTDPVPAERAVHDLEHGAVWITYRPDLPTGQVATLRAFVGRQSLVDESAATRIAGQRSRYADLSPWDDGTLPSPIVISSWGHQLRVDDPADPRLQRFVDTFRHSARYTPEQGAPVDGVPVRTGGRPATGGATVPDPPGTASENG